MSRQDPRVIFTQALAAAVSAVFRCRSERRVGRLVRRWAFMLPARMCCASASSDAAGVAPGPRRRHWLPIRM